ncbi:hypothetical protein H7R39_04570 [Campylobacter sp. Marseille-Q3452]|uniref:Uncharacterized protein n=1 Tax=Campylobacter massiliensis TaxID=2762557 RepID=A0A842J3Z9_9BACT|nr:hypothetical protein [Campylobacter massiliensis]MBC2882536.1 hypothetical protein [Campylobacter massiliensis]
MSRNYDENPLILQDDFYVIALSCVFLLGFNLFMTFLIFFSGMVDWQSGSFWEVFAAEAMRTRGFIWMFASVILANALAAADLIKKLKNPSLVYLYEDKIFQTKRGVTINLADIAQMRKSPYQILGAIPKNPLSAIVIPFMFVLAAFIFYALIFFAKCVLRAFDKDANLSYFCNLAIFSDTSVINIYFISKSDYAAVREYFASKLDTDVANAPWTIKFYDARNLQQP